MRKRIAANFSAIAAFLLLFLLSFVLIAFSGKPKTGNILMDNSFASDTIRDTVYIEKIVHDTVRIVNYVDTNILVIHKKAFLYIKDTFNIDDRTFYVTENNDTIKVFYHDYTYYIFKYFFKDTLVTVDSVLGCDLFTHCICDDRERIVIFHTCEGESRMIINMLNKKEKGKEAESGFKQK
jgi:hypothetical protein